MADQIPTAEIERKRQEALPGDARDDHPSPEEDAKAFAKDISRIALGGTQTRLTATRAGLERNEDADELQELRTHGSSGGSLDYAELVASSNRTAAQLDAQMAEVRRQRAAAQTDFKLWNDQLESLGKERIALAASGAELARRIDANSKSLKETSDAEQDARTRFNSRYAALNPDGPQQFQGDGPSPRELAELDLKNAAWDKHRASIADDFAAKGLSREFEIMESLRHGQHVDQRDINAAVDKIRAAGMTANLDAALLKKLQDVDPANPFLNTLDATNIGIQASSERNIDARREFIALQREEANKRQEEMNLRLREIEAQRGKQEAQDKLDRLDAQEREIREKQRQLEIYQKWLNDPKTKEGIENGTISAQDVENHKPGFMRNDAQPGGLALKVATAAAAAPIMMSFGEPAQQTLYEAHIAAQQTPAAPKLERRPEPAAVL